MKDIILKDEIDNHEIFWFMKKRKLSTTGIHHQDFHEIKIILNGSTYHYIRNEKEYVSKGNVLFIPKNSTHKLGDSITSKYVEYINIGFSDDILKSASSLLSINSLNDINNKITVNDKLLASFYTDFNLINNSNSADSAICDVKILVLKLLKELKSEKNKKDAYVPHWMHTILEEMDNFDNVKIGVTKIYELSPYSKQYTINKFKERLNAVPSTFINQKKIEYASMLLRTTEKDILTISLDCGYDTIENFYKNFKQFKGLTPSKYRKLYYDKKEDSY